jgi:hypothetical protein
MVLAGLLGRFIAQIATQHISNDVIKLAAGIATGLLVGIGGGGRHAAYIGTIHENYN